MDNFLNRLNRNPYQPIDSASITRVDELGNGYDDWNNLIAPKFEQPQQTWGETALGVATAPARMAAALAGSLSPYGADGWQVPPIVNEGVNALTAVGDAYNYGMSDDEINSRALGMAGFMMGGGGIAAGRGGMVAANASKEGAAPALISATQTGIGLPAFEMRAPGGKSIGRAQYDELPNAVRVKDVEIDPAFRRQGMASRLYGEIQDRTGKPLTPDTMLTPDGKAFWDSAYPKAVSDYEFDGQYWRQPYTPDEAVPDWRLAGGPNRPEDALWSNASKESSIPAIASALDMSPEARLARARDLGFDTENVVYHGTDKQFDSFMPSRGGSAGPGVYVTPNAKHARHFGDVKELMLRGKYATWADVPEAVTIRPWYRDFLGLDGGSPAIRAAEWARNNGYDGFKQEGYQTVVFDPRNIRSVNAAFDPAMSDSANLLAANADSRPALLASALGQEQKGITALDMGQEARLARAKEMGFDTDTPLYHGTNKTFTEFDPAKVGSQTGDGWLGNGFYFSPHADVANAYGSNVIEAYARLQNPYRFPEDVNPIKYVKEKGGPQEFTDWVKSQGHDGIISDRVLHQTAVFDPKNIRSVNAAFDPAMSDSANLLAANADSRPALLASALGQDDIPDWLLPYLPPQ